MNSSLIPEARIVPKPKAEIVGPNQALVAALELQPKAAVDAGLFVRSPTELTVDRNLLSPSMPGLLRTKFITRVDEISFLPGETSVVIGYEKGAAPPDLTTGNQVPSKPGETMVLTPMGSAGELVLALVKRRPVDPQRTIQRLDYIQQTDVAPFLAKHSDVVEYNRLQEEYRVADTRSQVVLKKEIGVLESKLDSQYSTTALSDLVEEVRYQQSALKKIDSLRAERDAFDVESRRIGYRRLELQKSIGLETAKSQSLKDQIDVLTPKVAKDTLAKATQRSKLVAERPMLLVKPDSKKLAELDKQIQQLDADLGQDAANANQLLEFQQTYATSQRTLQQSTSELASLPSPENLQARVNEINRKSGELFNRYYDITPEPASM